MQSKGINPAHFRRRAIDRYDGEIAHADRSFEQLIGKLEELGLLDNTLVVVLSDHDEEFWDHRWYAHGHSLHEELIRVAGPVQSIDVVPTVLELLGLEADGILRGQSVVALLEGKPFARRTPVMSSRFAHPNRSAPEVPEYRTGTFARLDSDWKLLYRDQAARAGFDEIELCDRRRDRHDSTNLAAEHPEVAREFKQEIESWTEAQEEIRNALGPRSTSTLDPKTLERLRSLGYIGPKASPETGTGEP